MSIGDLNLFKSFLYDFQQLTVIDLNQDSVSDCYNSLCFIEKIIGVLIIGLLPEVLVFTQVNYSNSYICMNGTSIHWVNSIMDL